MLKLVMPSKSYTCLPTLDSIQIIQIHGDSDLWDTIGSCLSADLPQAVFEPNSTMIA